MNKTYLGDILHGFRPAIYLFLRYPESASCWYCTYIYIYIYISIYFYVCIYTLINVYLWFFMTVFVWNVWKKQHAISTACIHALLFFISGILCMQCYYLSIENDPFLLFIFCLCKCHICAGLVAFCSLRGVTGLRVEKVLYVRHLKVWIYRVIQVWSMCYIYAHVGCYEHFFTSQHMPKQFPLYIVS